MGLAVRPSVSAFRWCRVDRLADRGRSASVPVQPAFPSLPSGRSGEPANCRIGNNLPSWAFACAKSREENMNGLIYLIGLIVVILAILSFFGLR